MSELFDKATAWFSGFLSDIHSNFIEENRFLLLLDGLKVTVFITLGAAAVAVVLGFLTALARISKSRLLSVPAGVYMAAIRGTPLLIQLLIFYYAVFSGERVSKELAAVAALGINGGAYFGEILHAKIAAVDKGQSEAARCLGLNYVQTMLYIILPQAFRNALPPLFNEVSALMKKSSVVGYIALTDLISAGDYIAKGTQSAYMPLLAAALIYYGLGSALSAVFKRLERRLQIDTR